MNKVMTKAKHSPVLRSHETAEGYCETSCRFLIPSAFSTFSILSQPSCGEMTTLQPTAFHLRQPTFPSQISNKKKHVTLLFAKLRCKCFRYINLFKVGTIIPNL